MENMLYAVTYTLYSLFEMYILYKLMNLFLGKPICEKKYVLLIYALRFVVSTVQYYCLPYVWLNSMVGVVMLFAVTFCYGKNLQKKIVSVVISFMCMISAEIVVVTVYELCNVEMVAEGHNGNEYAYIGIAIVLGIIFKLISCFVNVDNEVLIPKRFNVVISVVSIMILLQVTMIFVQENVSKSVKIISSLCLLLILFLLMYLYDLIAKNYTERMQAEIIKKEKQYYYKQIELMQENGKNLSNFRHDINNHLSVILGMLENDSESTKEYIEKLVNKLEYTRTFSSTGNIAVDSVINYKLSKAEDEGISVNADITLPQGLGNDAGDMVTIFGNLLDNAIEANRVPDIEKCINISAKYKSGMMFIKVANSYDGRMNIENGQIATKKPDKELHGIGLKSVQSVVDKYNGTMDIDYDDKKFESKIMLYI